MPEYISRLRALVGNDELLQLPSVSIALKDGEGRVLLARHSTSGRWVLPGGAIEPGEAPADAAIREMREETGILVRLTHLVGVFGGPQFIVQYQNGDRTSYVMAVYEAVCEAGVPQPDGLELLEVRFATEAEAGQLDGASWLPEVLAAIFHPATSVPCQQPEPPNTVTPA